MKGVKQKQEMMRDLIILGIILIIMLTLLSVFPDKKEIVFSTSWDFFIEMILILLQ